MGWFGVEEDPRDPWWDQEKVLGEGVDPFWRQGVAWVPSDDPWEESNG